MSAQWKRVEEIFHAASGLEPSRRAEFLATACGGDPALLEEVRSLLVCDTTSEDLFGDAIGEVAASVSSDPAGPERIGIYRIERRLGQGGMGSVYLAVRDDDQYRKQVALKIIRRGMDSPLLIERFRYERQILATLEHPHIARLLDGGSTAEGLPYLVMEYVQGETLTDYCSGRKLDLIARLRIFREICGAVSYAHRKLIIHRDLKPANILVTDDGDPRLLDFGTAKLLSPEFDGQVTHTGERMLTPDYASPEQLRGEPASTATDVYSLGVVLYELLVGRRPYETQGNYVLALERIVTGTDPAPPSDIAKVSQPKLQRLLRGDLDRIVLKAMRREPERRYDSVEQLSEDVRRYLEGLPVLARQDTITYRAAKFIRRNKLAMAALCAGLFAIAAGSGVAFWQAHVARQAAKRAEQRFADVRSLANTFLFDTQEKLRAIPGTMAVRKNLVDTALLHLAKLANESDDDPQLQFELATAYDRVGRILGNPAETNFGDTKQALVHAKQSLALFEKAISASSANEEWLIGASASYRHFAELVNQNNSREARTTMLRSVEIGRRAVAVGHTKERLDNLRSALVRLSEYQRPAGDLPAALQSAEEAIAVSLRLVQESPGASAQRALANSHCAAGITRRQANQQLEAALKDLVACREIREKLAATGQATASDVRNLGLSYLEISLLESLVHSKDPRIAVRSAEKSLKTFQAAASDTDDSRSLGDLASAHVRLGSSLKTLDPGRAIHHFYEAIRLRSSINEDLANLSRLTSARNDLAELLVKQGRHKGAKEQLDKALEVNDRVLKEDSERTFYLESGARTHSLLSDFHAREKRWKEAIHHCDSSVELASKLNRMGNSAATRVRLAEAHVAAGLVSEAAGNRVRAAESYRKSLALWPDGSLPSSPAEARTRDKAAALLAAASRK